MSQSLTVWIEPTATFVDDGDTVTAVFAATVEIPAGQASVTLPILADPAAGGLADVRMPGAVLRGQRPDQGPQLIRLLLDVRGTDEARFGQALATLADVIDRLPTPLTYQEWLQLRTIVRSRDNPPLQLAQTALDIAIVRGLWAKIVAAAEAKIGPVDLRTVPPLNPLSPAAATPAGALGAVAAVLTAAPDWQAIVQNVAQLVDKLGDNDPAVRAAAEADLSAMITKYVTRADLTRASIVTGELYKAAGSHPSPQVRLTISGRDFLPVAIGRGLYARYLEAKLAAAAAASGGWVYTP